MKKFKVLKTIISWIIIIHFFMPFHEKEYRHVKSWTVNMAGTIYTITMDDLSVIYLPTAFTVIEEK